MVLQAYCAEHARTALRCQRKKFLCHALGRDAVLLVVLHCLYCLAHACVHVAAGVALCARASEARLYVARKQAAHLYAKLAHLVAHSHSHSVYCRFRCRVESLIWYWKCGSKTAYKDYLSVVLVAHVWQYRLRYVYCAEEVNVELTLGLVDVGKLYRARDAHSGVAYQHVNLSGFGCHLCRGVTAVVGTGNVTVNVSYSCAVFAVSRQLVNLVSFSRKKVGSSLSDARTSACDNQCSHTRRKNTKKSPPTKELEGINIYLANQIIACCQNQVPQQSCGCTSSSCSHVQASSTDVDRSDLGSQPSACG